MPVGNRTGLNGVYGSSNEIGDYVFIESLTRHRIPLGAKELRVCWSGFHVDLHQTEFPARARAAAVCELSPHCRGFGYKVGDVITLSGACELSPARAIVVEVLEGEVRRLSILDPGLFAQALADAELGITGGHGHGLTCLARWSELAGGNCALLESARPDLGRDGHRVPIAPPAVSRTPVGGMAISDAIGFDLPAGSQIELRHFGTYGGSGRLTLAGVEFATGRTGFERGAMATPLSPTANAFPFTQPLCLLGRPFVPGHAIAILGDGIANGSTGVGRDVCTPEGYIGWAEKALAESVAWSNFSCDGDSLSRWVGSSGRRGMRLDAIASLGFDTVLTCLSLNDFTLGWSVEDIVDAEREVVSEFRARGISRIICVTTTPVTASTDNWSTAEGQSFTSISEAINRRNRMLRDRIYPVDFDLIWDVAAMCEVPENPGIWAAGLTDDGYHPNTLCHNLIAKQFHRTRGYSGIYNSILQRFGRRGQI